MSRYCQRIHWSSHKKFCEKLSKSRLACAGSTKDNKENDKNSPNNKEDSGPIGVPGGRVDQTATAVEGVISGTP